MGKVLIVDDSKLARMVVRTAINTLHPGWTCIEAASVNDALIIVAQESFDLALLDFQMPERNGLELATELRRLNPSMPMALISANKQQQIVLSAHALAVSFLSKPLNTDALSKFLDDTNIV